MGGLDATAERVQADLTEALGALVAGDPDACARVFPILYTRLHELAEAQLAHQAPGHTLQPTALVHEAYLRLVDQGSGEGTGADRWESRAHFFAVAARAMRHILIDHARGKKRLKRGGDLRRVPLSGVEVPESEGAEGPDLVAIDEALERLAAHDPVSARVVEMRFFGGMDERAVAAVLGVTDRTVRRHWAYARAWLARELGRPKTGGKNDGSAT